MRGAQNKRLTPAHSHIEAAGKSGTEAVDWPQRPTVISARPFARESTLRARPNSQAEVCTNPGAAFPHRECKHVELHLAPARYSNELERECIAAMSQELPSHGRITEALRAIQADVPQAPGTQHPDRATL